MKVSRLGALAVVGPMLFGCTGIPGVTGVGFKSDNPDRTWTETKFNETYGQPQWSQALEDGRKMVYFEYRTAEDGITNDHALDDDGPKKSGRSSD